VKSKKSFFVLCSLLLSAAMFAQLAFAQARTTGVSEGDWFKYGFSFEWDSGLNMTFEDFAFSDFLEGEWAMLSVQGVSGTNVTGQFTIHFENGTETLMSGSVDVSSGAGNLAMWLISADLNADDFLYQSEFNEAMINETVIRDYHWGSRETNHIMYSYEYTSEELNSSIRADMYWDQEMGILTQLSFNAELQQEGNTTAASVSCVITESNIENIPEFTQPALMLMLVTLTTLCFMIKKKRKLQHPTSTQH